MNKQLKLVSLGDVKTAKDNRQYYSANFQDPTNPFARAISRIFWQQKNTAGEAVWRGADPEAVKPFVGKLLPGYIATKKVAEYAIGDRTADTYTTVILGSELESQVFKGMGHPLAEEAKAEVAVEAADALVIS